MPCSTKPTIGGINIPVTLISFAVLIIAFVIFASEVPTSSCGSFSSVNIDKEDQDAINGIMFVISLPLLAGAILGLLSGGFGMCGGFGVCGNKCNNPCCTICTSAVTGGCGAFFMLLGGFIAMVMASIFAVVCDDSTCGAAAPSDCWGYLAFECLNPDVCCRCDGSRMYQMCKESHDWVCDMKNTKMSAMVFAYLGFILLLVGSACGCAAGCCCTKSFTETAAAQEAKVGPPPAVVGQPIGQPIQGDTAAKVVVIQ